MLSGGKGTRMNIDDVMGAVCMVLFAALSVVCMVIF